MVRFNKLFVVLAFLVLGTALVITGCGKNDKANKPAAESSAQDPAVLRISAVPAEDAEKTRQTYSALVSYLEKKLNKKVELYVATDYSGVVEAMRSGKVDCAQFGPFSYILAANKAKAEAFAVGKANGTTSYRSVIIAPAGTSIKSLTDLKGKTFAFVDPASTSGNLIPRFMFTKAGINPDKDFKSVIYAGGHDAVALSIKNNKVEAGATNNLNLDKMAKAKAISPSDYVVIAESQDIPSSPWAYRGDLSPELKEAIKQAFLDAAQEDPAALANADGVMESYEPTDDASYDVIRETAKTLNLDLSTLK